MMCQNVVKHEFLLNKGALILCRCAHSTESETWLETPPKSPVKAGIPYTVSKNSKKKIRDPLFIGAEIPSLRSRDAGIVL
jgi:hypothetical protein